MRKNVTVRPRFRIYAGDQIALGPGKADLLAAIKETGSIQSAAEALNMSYMRAWKLVRTMNQCFKDPLVEAARGGKTKGGARLSVLGQRVLKLYLLLEKKSIQSTASIHRQIVSELK